MAAVRASQKRAAEKASAAKTVEKPEPTTSKDPVVAALEELSDDELDEMLRRDVAASAAHKRSGDSPIPAVPCEPLLGETQARPSPAAEYDQVYISLDARPNIGRWHDTVYRADEGWRFEEQPSGALRIYDQKNDPKSFFVFGPTQWRGRGKIK